MLVDNWRQVLLRSWSVWLSTMSSALLVLAGAVYVKADEWGDDTYLTVVAVLCGMALVCAVAGPLARIIKQPSLH